MLGVAWTDMISIGRSDKPSEQKIEGALHLSRLECLYKTYHPSPIAIIIIRTTHSITTTEHLSSHHPIIFYNPNLPFIPTPR